LRPTRGPRAERSGRLEESRPKVKRETTWSSCVSCITHIGTGKSKSLSNVTPRIWWRASAS
jgi:hypothetical protein